jgi:hypothetical protein
MALAIVLRILCPCYLPLLAAGIGRCPAVDRQATAAIEAEGCTFRPTITALAKSLPPVRDKLEPGMSSVGGVEGREEQPMEGNGS